MVGRGTQLQKNTCSRTPRRQRYHSIFASEVVRSVIIKRKKKFHHTRALADVCKSEQGNRSFPHTAGNGRGDQRNRNEGKDPLTGVSEENEKAMYARQLSSFVPPERSCEQAGARSRVNLLSVMHLLHLHMLAASVCRVVLRCIDVCRSLVISSRCCGS